MKKLFLLLFLIPNLALAGWKLVIQDTMSGSRYVDFDQIHELDGYIYYKVLDDYYKKDTFGDHSQILYFKGDCINFRIEPRSFETYSKPMGKGKATSKRKFTKRGWKNSSPKSTNGRILKSVCSHANK